MPPTSGELLHYFVTIELPENYFLNNMFRNYIFLYANRMFCIYILTDVLKGLLKSINLKTKSVAIITIQMELLLPFRLEVEDSDEIVQFRFILATNYSRQRLLY